MNCNKRTPLMMATLLGSTILASTAYAQNLAVDGNNGTLPLPDGQFVTPTAIPGAIQKQLNPGLPAYPNFVAGMAVKSQLSPDGNTLAIITAGQNSLDDKTGKLDVANSTQYVFLYDVSGANKQTPALKQVIQQPNAHVGLVWSADGNTLYAAGGNDDAVYVYTKTNGTFAKSATVALGHPVIMSNGKPVMGSFGQPEHRGVGLGVQSNTSGLALTADGKTLVVANNYNDSISLISTASNTVIAEHDLRPYANEGTAGVAGGEYPLSVVVQGNNTVYVGSNRDREVVKLDIKNPQAITLLKRIPVDGNANGMTFDSKQKMLYVAQDNQDEVAAIDTRKDDTVVAEIDTRAPAGTLTGPHYTGAAPFAVTVSPDDKTLYAVNDGSNSIAVIPLKGANAYKTVGLLPTAYAPKDVTFSADGEQMYIINGKSDQGANPGHLTGSTSRLTSVTYPGGNAAAAAAANASNQYQFQLEHATLVSAPVPSTEQLAALTAQVAKNNFYNAQLSSADQATMDAVKAQIKHVIYIVKENRTFDQMLGDLGNGSDGDPSLAVFGKRITPNFHRLASNFVTLDNFMDAADGSMDGWSLATRGRVTTTEEITQQLNYASVNRGMSYESEGSNRSVPVGLTTTAARDAATNGGFSSNSASLPGGTANLLPGTNNISSTDAPYGIQQGFIYDAVLQAGGTVRNYGFLVNNIGSIGTVANPVVNPFAAGIVQVAPVDPSLLNLTDVYFRNFDQNYPDLWRFYEWNREFQQYVANGNLPSLETVRLSHDHMGFSANIEAGLTTPEAEQADDDYAVGQLVQAVANSPYASSTLIIVTEDDSQDGPDHVDSHRTTTYAIGPYVKQHAIISARYSQVSVLRTIEDILGTQHINLNTAYQRPMVEIFDPTMSPAWTYSAIASTVLKNTTVIQAANETGVKYAEGPTVVPTHDAAYWIKATKGFDVSDADRVPPGLFNRVIWEGLKGNVPYPTVRSGKTESSVETPKTVQHD
jgi:DNA-binding beta-propeller fold protein YncE